MMPLRQHVPDDYAALPHIDFPGTGDLSDDDRDCLNEVGQHLLVCGAQDRFGAILLHRHFHVEPDETCVETVDRAARKLVSRPVRAVTGDLAATGILFEPEATGAGFRCVGLEFAAAEALANVAPIGEADGRMLDGAAGILARRGKLRRFGLHLMHDPLGLRSEILMETCDPVGRVLVCTAIPEAAAGGTDSIATAFRWTGLRTDGGRSVSQQCVPVRQCYRDNPDGPHQVVSYHKKQ